MFRDLTAKQIIEVVALLLLGALCAFLWVFRFSDNARATDEANQMGQKAARAQVQMIEIKHGGK
jgi:hypothetical protein